MESKRPQPFGGDALEEFQDKYDKNMIIFSMLEIIEKLNSVKVFSCGKCGETIIVEKGKPIPQFCILCGMKIEWGTLLKEDFVVCIKCDKKYLKDTADYCEVDGSRLE